MIALRLCGLEWKHDYYSYQHFTDSYHALHLLQQYHGRLIKPEQSDLKNDVENIMTVFKSDLFGALIGLIFLLEIFFCCTFVFDYRCSLPDEPKNWYSQLSY